MSVGEEAEDGIPTSQEMKTGDNTRAGVEKAEPNEPR